LKSWTLYAYAILFAALVAVLTITAIELSRTKERVVVQATISPAFVEMMQKEAVQKREYKKGEQLKPKELKKILEETGFEGKSLRSAWAIAMKESTGRPMSHNKNSDTGDNSYGLFQINMIGSLGPARLEKYNLESNKDLFDPAINAKIAYKMSNGGKDWSAWRGITESTKKWMKEFPE
jgi:hypothetical protein